MASLRLTYALLNNIDHKKEPGIEQSSNGAPLSVTTARLFRDDISVQADWDQLAGGFLSVGIPFEQGR